ncbi:MAG TPA: hypothetical protein VMG10_33035 [Gemmataceae bacterium]|nr:hypothetical protein [Gemmataceae bacterium]
MRALIILQLQLGSVALPPLTAQQPSRPATKIPRWDARGVGPLPWQGITCLDTDAERTAASRQMPPRNKRLMFSSGPLLIPDVLDREIDTFTPRLS